MAELKLNHVPYRIWKNKPEQKELSAKLLDEAKERTHCPYCNGNGVHSCECGDTHDCNYCGGTGLTSEVEKELDYILTSLYSKLCAEDEMKFLKWSGV